MSSTDQLHHQRRRRRIEGSNSASSRAQSAPSSSSIPEPTSRASSPRPTRPLRREDPSPSHVGPPSFPRCHQRTIEDEAHGLGRKQRTMKNAEKVTQRK
ncbi:hypothetical protein M0R45_030320 [Rubus argutus]|uniref:Uncharacterized protein n=1 Tax=Rubus argutus TaxID=59490 RepID=A0AAW1WED4_RUBAR